MGMDASMISQMKAMEDQNRRLKQVYSDLSMLAYLLTFEDECHWFERT